MHRDRRRRGNHPAAARRRRCVSHSAAKGVKAINSTLKDGTKEASARRKLVLNGESERAALNDPLFLVHFLVFSHFPPFPETERARGNQGSSAAAAVLTLSLIPTISWTDNGRAPLIPSPSLSSSQNYKSTLRVGVRDEGAQSGFPCSCGGGSTREKSGGQFLKEGETAGSKKRSKNLLSFSQESRANFSGNTWPFSQLGAKGEMEPHGRKEPFSFWVICLQ